MQQVALLVTTNAAIPTIKAVYVHERARASCRQDWTQAHGGHCKYFLGVMVEAAGTEQLTVAVVRCALPENSEQQVHLMLWPTACLAHISVAESAPLLLCK